MESVKETWHTLRTMNKRELASQFLNLAMIICSAVVLWRAAMAMSGSESPIVVVLSGSMEPTMFRGDILFLWLGSEPFKVGEIVVYKLEGRDVPIVHRILEVHDDENGEQLLLTKGDNNRVADRGLYNPGQRWLEPKNVIGRVRGFLPHVGRLTIYLTDYPFLKVVLIVVMGIVVVTSKE